MPEITQAGKSADNSGKPRFSNHTVPPPLLVAFWSMRAKMGFARRHSHFLLLLLEMEKNKVIAQNFSSSGWQHFPPLSKTNQPGIQVIVLFEN